jgi:6-phospho-3-hexuloisomerase
MHDLLRGRDPFIKISIQINTGIHLQYLTQAYNELLNGIRKAMEELDPIQVEEFLESLLTARTQEKKVLVVGAGRSGLVGRAFAMRLMHLGFNVHVLGETINPYIGAGDVVVVVSGSGSTTLPVTVTNMAKELGAKVLAVTSQPESPIGLTADVRVEIPGRERIVTETEYHSRQLRGEHASLAPMGTMFEDTCMIFLDSVIVELMTSLGLTEETMKRRHATIE